MCGLIFNVSIAISHMSSADMQNVVISMGSWGGGGWGGGGGGGGGGASFFLFFVFFGF